MKDSSKKIQKRWVFPVLISVLIAAAAVAWAYLASKKLPVVPYSIDDWRMEHMVYRDGAFRLDETVKDSGEWAQLLWGPYKEMKKGSYTARIEYSAEADLRCLAGAEGQEVGLVTSSEGILSRHLQSVSYQFEIAEDIKTFELLVFYDGTGDFSISSLSIVPNNDRNERIAAEIIAAVVLCDLFLVFLALPVDQKRTVAALAGITAAVSLPLFLFGTHAGHDLEVHYMRIEALVQALRSRQFPARISSILNYGLGYPYSVFYNDIFLYIPAVFRLLGFSVNTAYKIYVLFINGLTVLISYFSFKKIFHQRRLGIMLTFVYASAAYRFTNLYVRAAVGEYTAQAFLPLFALVVYRLFFEENRSFRFLAHTALILAAAMSGIVGSNIPTLCISGFVFFLICLFFIKKLIRKQTFLTVCASVLLTVFLSLYFLVPFTDYYLTEPISISGEIDNGVMLIQGRGAFPAQLFAFNQTLAGVADAPAAGRMQLSPGFVLIFAFLAGLYLLIFRKTGTRFRFAFFFSCLMLWLASDLFPWNWLLFHVPAWDVLTHVVQFPWRFLTFAVLFLTLLSGEMLSEYGSKTIDLVLAVILTAVSFWLCGDVINHSEIIYVYDTSGLRWDAIEPQGHFLLRGSDSQIVDTELVTENIANAEILSRKSNSLTLYCQAGNNDRAHLLSVPLYGYTGYHVADTDGNEYPFTLDKRNMIQFEVPDGFEGNFSIEFRDPPYWKAALVVSVLCAVCAAGWLIAERKRKG